MQLLRSQLVIRPGEDDGEMKTASGIVVPGKESPFAKGTVVSLGEYAGRALDGTPIKSILNVGDSVLYMRNAGTDFEVDGESGLLLMEEGHVIAVLGSDD